MSAGDQDYKSCCNCSCHSEPQGRMAFGNDQSAYANKFYSGPVGNKPPSTSDFVVGNISFDKDSRADNQQKVSTQFYLLLDKHAHELHEVANSLAEKLSQVSSPMSDAKKEDDIKHAWPEYFDGLRDIAESIESSVEVLKMLDKYLEF